MTEKDINQKETQNEKENEPLLNELIETMKKIKKEMSDSEKEERITVFLEYMRERKNNTSAGKENVDIESLLNTFFFKPAKNGKSEFANISKELGAKLPQSFEHGGYSYYNKGDALIRVKKTSKQKKTQ
jgi:ABC-type Fe3+-hydroxamate transport system substrate-binding protein